MGSQVILDPRLDERVVLWNATVDAEAVFHAGELLIVDGIEWLADLSIIRTALSPKRRKFKAPFSEGPVSKVVAAELDKMGEQAEALVAKLYPRLKRGSRVSSFRPMISGPEPMHFDTYAEPTPYLTSFTNVSKVARTYKISHSLPALVEKFPEVMRSVLEDHDYNGPDDLSYALRLRSTRNQPPLGNDAPRHTVHFAPGAIWFFDPKLLSHEVIYGEGAMSFSWPAAGKTQSDYMRAL